MSNRGNEGRDNPFDQSARTERTPPTSSQGKPPKVPPAVGKEINNEAKPSTTGSQISVAKPPIPYTSKSDKKACNACERYDLHTKLICAICKRWWHMKCDKRGAPTVIMVSSGKWICENCSKEDADGEPSGEPSGEHDITRSHITDTNMLPGDPPFMGDKNSTRRGEGGKEPSKTGSKGRESDSSSVRQEKLKLLEREHELAQQDLKLAYERKKIQVERDEIEDRRTKLSSQGSVIESERRRSVEICNNWFSTIEEARSNTSNAGNVVPKTNPSRKAISFMNPELGLDEFLDLTLQSQPKDRRLNLSQSQVYARQVVSKELPIFSGDPRDWPIFISKLRESTQQCGFTASENLDRLSRCLKGQAYDAVRTDLANPEALSSVIATLRMLYGRPETIYHALVNHVRDSPPVKIEKLDTLITFGMRVKGLCDTLKAAEMLNYLNHPSLLTELTSRLPPMLNYRWADYLQVMSDTRSQVTIETFNVWLRQQIEKLSRVSMQAPTTQSTTPNPSKQSTNTRSNKRTNADGFQGTHQAEVNKELKHCKSCDDIGHVASECEKFKELSVAKRWHTVRRRFMCVCCLGKHVLRNCGVMTICGIDGCTQPHHKLLHSANGEYDNADTTDTKGKPSTSKSTQHHQEISSNDESLSVAQAEEPVSERVLVHTHKGSKFQIVPVYLSNGDDKSIKTYAFLDSGSEITIVEDKLMKKLGISGPVEGLKLKWSNQCSRSEPKSQRVQIYVTGMDQRETHIIKNARTVQLLELPLQSIETEHIERFKHLRGIPLEEYTDARPEILIGLDNHFLMSPLEVVEGSRSEPIAIKTRLGWTIFGNSTGNELNDAYINSHRVEPNDLHSLVEDFFSMESIGIKNPTKQIESNEDARARKILEATIKQEIDGKYEVGLLWKTNEVNLPESRAMARCRLQCFERKLSKDPQLRIRVNKLLQEYHDMGYLEKLDDDQIHKITSRTWYLPLFVVTNPNKPGKERIVWDAAATVNGESLNSQLLTGPDLNANLVSVLYKFRERLFALGGDIQQMFHQIRIRNTDQDSQRCLWREDTDKPICTSRMTVATFGAACSPSIAQFVKNFHANKYILKFPRAVDAITHRHYVDDYVDSFDTWEEGKKVAEQVAQIHIEGGFYIRSFVSNEPRMISRLPHDEKILERPIEQFEPSTKVLGMWWDTRDDVLRYRINEDRIGRGLLNGVEVPTKREVLRTVMMTFDPLGLLGFFTLKGKLVVKAIWRTQVEWDDMIQKDEMQLWLDWIDDLKKVSLYEIRRCYFTEANAKEFELHIFVDAGENAAAAVAYVVGCFPGKRETMIVASKTKVAPNKCVSIPRMELQAAVIGTRLSTHVKETHSINFVRCTLWTDSRNVMCWIRSPKRFKVFVAHRISEIRETTNPSDWRYIPTKMNPADHATKWKNQTDQAPLYWFTGPEFLSQNEKAWPEEPTNLPEITEDILEIRCNVQLFDQTTSACPDVTRFSSWNRFLRTLARVLRIMYRKKGPVNVSTQEMKDAETYVFREVQMIEFEKDYQQLKEGKPIMRGSRLQRLSPFLDPEGVMRLKSRLQEAEYLSYNQRNPIILPNKHPLTRLIVHHMHEKYWHANYNTVLNELRQLYIIPNVRTILKSVRATCQTCKIRRARPEVPEMSVLPRSRLAARIRPFTYVGVDCFGPILVKVHRKHEKR